MCIIKFKAVSKHLHGSELKVDILKSKEEEDHVQFLITEDSEDFIKSSLPEDSSIILSEGNKRIFIGK